MIQQAGVRPSGPDFGHLLLQGNHAFCHPTGGVFFDFIQHD
jgi:hypothetical protein